MSLKKQDGGDDKGHRKPNKPFPPTTLEEAVNLADAIRDYNAGQPFDRLLLADALGIKPSSSNFRDLLKAGYQYGLTIGSEKSEKISLSPLGTKLTKPMNPGERSQAIVEAALAPELAGRIYRHYNRNKMPGTEFLKNALERQFQVPTEWSRDIAGLLDKNARYAGLVRAISGSDMVLIDSAGPAASTQDEVRAPSDALPEESVTQETKIAATTPVLAGDKEMTESQVRSLGPTTPTPKATHIFLGHGKNKKPLEQLKNMLNEFKITYRVTVEEPNRGLPIPDKVAELMRQCSSAILIFTKDELFFDKGGSEIWRPSENVIHELGAASILYGGRIIILKERGISLPSNFSSVGYIEFDTDALAAKGIDLLKELIAFGLVRAQIYLAHQTC
jgi:predicted nucleotide-binding protein